MGVASVIFTALLQNPRETTEGQWLTVMLSPEICGFWLRNKEARNFFKAIHVFYCAMTAQSAILIEFIAKAYLLSLASEINISVDAKARPVPSPRGGRKVGNPSNGVAVA